MRLFQYTRCLFNSHPFSIHQFSKILSCRESDEIKYWVYNKLGGSTLMVCCSDVSQKCGGPLCAPITSPWWAALSVSVEVTYVRVLGKQFWLQVEPLHDVLRHTQDWIHGLDLFISKQREACYSKESVKRVHLQGEREQEDWKDRERYYLEICESQISASNQFWSVFFFFDKLAEAHHVSWSISKTSSLFILTGKDECSQLGLIDPMDLTNDFQWCQNPPRVTYVWKLKKNRLVFRKV